MKEHVIYIIEKERIDTLLLDVESEDNYTRSTAIQKFKKYISTIEPLAVPSDET